MMTYQVVPILHRLGNLSEDIFWFRLGKINIVGLPYGKMCEGMGNVFDTLAEIFSIQIAYLSVDVDPRCKLSHVQGNIEHLDVSAAHGDKLPAFGPYAGKEQMANVGGEIAIST